MDSMFYVIGFAALAAAVFNIVGLW